MNSFYLITLDKKLLTVQHKITKEEVQALAGQHNITPEQMQEEIYRQLYGKFLQGIGKNIPVEVETTEEILKYTIRGYILSDRQMMETILEICELDDDSKRMMIEKIYKILGING